MECTYCGKEIKPTDFSIEHQTADGVDDCGIFCDELCFTKHHDKSKCPDLKKVVDKTTQAV